MIRILRDPDYSFIGHRSKGYIISAIVIILGIVSLFMKSGPEYSIDFTGGTLIELRFEHPADLEIVRESIESAGLTDFEIQTFGEESEILLRTQEIGVEHGEISSFIPKLREENKDNPFEVMRTESVGPKIGGELKEKALLSILYSMLGLIAYITWRYEFKFAIAAIIALIHDVMITLGVFSILDKEISLAVVAAFLTIIGYSLNDTIVVFDRIRENIQNRRKVPYQKILNMSINETLSRTLITSMSTLIVVLALYVYGGEVIKNFAFALIIGVLVGTYSSIYVASPMLLVWSNLFKKEDA